MVFEPLDFIGKLMPLLPPARVNQVRYHGVLAPAAAWRDHIVPSGERRQEQRCSKRKNYSWAELMARVFEFDVLACPKCDGRMRWVATIMDRETIRILLRASGLSSNPPLPDPVLRLIDRKLMV